MKAVTNSRPDAWSPVHARMAEEEDLPWFHLASVDGAVRASLDPVLAGAEGTWVPAARAGNLTGFEP